MRNWRGTEGENQTFQQENKCYQETKMWQFICLLTHSTIYFEKNYLSSALQKEGLKTQL